MRTKEYVWRQNKEYWRIWEEPLVDPPIHDLACVIVPWSLVLSIFIEELKVLC